MFHFPVQLIVGPSGVAKVNMKNARIGPLTESLLQNRFVCDQVNLVEDVRGAFELGTDWSIAKTVDVSTGPPR